MLVSEVIVYHSLLRELLSVVAKESNCNRTIESSHIERLAEYEFMLYSRYHHHRIVIVDLESLSKSAVPEFEQSSRSLGYQESTFF